MQLNGEIPEEDLSQSTDSEMEDATPFIKENEEPQISIKNLKNMNFAEEDKKIEPKDEYEK